MATTFIYTLADPDTLEVRYVGKANDPAKRLRNHLSHCSIGRTYSARWLCKLVDEGKKPVLQVLEEVDTEVWPERECYWIAHFNGQGMRLTNTASGGKGALGIHHTEEARQRMSERARATGRRPPPHSPELNAWMSENYTGRQHSEEAKAKISARFKGKPLTEEHKEKLRRAKQERFANPEARAHFSRMYAALTDEQVLEIWRLATEGVMSQRKISEMFGVHNSIISEIKTGKRYKHVKRPTAE